MKEKRWNNRFIKICGKYIPFVVYFLNMLFLHYRGYILDSDDRVRMGELYPTIKEELMHLSRAYRGHSSRYIIDPVIYLCLHMDIRIWLFINALIMAGIYALLYYLFIGKLESHKAWITLPFMLVFPFYHMVDVGWISTAVSYEWSLFMGLLSCVLVRRFLDDKTVKPGQAVLLIVATLLACDKEELSVGLLLLFSFMAVYSEKTGRKLYSVCFALQAVAALSRVLMHFLATGNAERYTNSAETTRTFAEKIEIGISQSLHRFLIRFDLTFAVFVIVIMIVVFQRGSRSEKRIGILLTGIWLLLSFVMGFVAQGIMHKGWFDPYLVEDVASFCDGKYLMPGTWVLMACVAVIWGGILYSLYRWGGTGTSLISAAVLISAFAGRSVAGFAGVWPQMLDRTYVIAYAALVGIMMKLGTEVPKDFAKKKLQAYMELLIGVALAGEIANAIGLYIF